MIQIEQNPKLGFYKVGSEIFYSKPQAYIYATKTKQPIHWNFNNLEYAKIDWSVEPETNLRELYRQRAQQLRDRYDYIRLECSGGGDSTTVAYSFLLNNIHLDEVIFRYPKTGEKDATNDPFNTKPTNTLSEYQFAAKPLLEWIKTNYPKTRVVIHDYSENMLEQESSRDESWIYNTRDWFQPGHGDKYDHFGTREHRDLADSGKKICALIGVDKPRMAIVNDEWYCYFHDVQANSANPNINGYTNISSELFFWTPDLPEITIKQAHMIRTWFEMPQNQYLKYLVQWPNSDISRRTAYEFIAKSIIYPDYDLQTWQTAKPTNSFYNEMDYWFYVNFRETNLYNAWQAGLRYLVDNIDGRFFTYEFGKPVGLEANISPLYWIGSGAPDKKPVLSNHSNLPPRELVTIRQRKLKKILA